MRFATQQQHALLDRLDALEQQILLESLVGLAATPVASTSHDRDAWIGRQLREIVAATEAACDEKDADAAEIARTDANDYALERSVQCNAMNRRAA